MSRVRDKRAEQYNTVWEWKTLLPGDAAGAIVPSGASSVASSFLYTPSLMGVKRKSRPLDILGLPGYDRLTEEEKQLCATLRLVPTAYMEYKQQLLIEHSKAGYLRLAEARRLIKIDVNKTRQLYDFLLKGGFIMSAP